jgi:hypothetical protein
VQAADQVQWQVDREEDGRLISEVPELPGVIADGDTQEAAMAKAEALALRVSGWATRPRGSERRSQSVISALS